MTKKHLIHLLSSAKGQQYDYCDESSSFSWRGSWKLCGKRTLLKRINQLFLATDLLFRLFMVLENKLVISEHQALGQKDSIISTVCWSGDGGGKERLADRGWWSFNISTELVAGKKVEDTALPQEILLLQAVAFLMPQISRFFAISDDRTCGVRVQFQHGLLVNRTYTAVRLMGECFFTCFRTQSVQRIDKQGDPLFLLRLFLQMMRAIRPMNILVYTFLSFLHMLCLTAFT